MTNTNGTPAADEPSDDVSTDVEVPEADALDQARDVSSGPVTDGTMRGPVSRDIEVPEADAIDQAMEVPVDPDDV